MSKTMIETIEKKQKNENQQVEFSNSKKLKSFLQSAMNTATSLTNYIPKITSELIVCINTYQSNQKNKIKLKDNSERFDTFKSLREFSLSLSQRSIWENHPIKVSYISFGSLQTKAVNEKHPDRTLMSLETVCNVIESVLKQDEDNLISEYRIDPIQKNNN